MTWLDDLTRTLIFAKRKREAMEEYLEIERRFFVGAGHGQPWRECLRKSEISQFYLDVELFTNTEADLRYDGVSVGVLMNEIERQLFESTRSWTTRIRIDDDNAILTLKGLRVHSSATELEWPIPREIADRILDVKNYPSIVKTRFYWQGTDGMVWEIDEFGGVHSSLILAEIELPNAQHEIALPEWLGEEITGQHEWSNSTLSRQGFE